MCSSRPSSRRTSVYCQEDPSKIQQGRESGKWLNVKIIAVQGTMVVINTGTSIFQVNASKPRRQLDTADLEEPTDSCERTGAPVLRLSCEGEIDVCELFSDNFYLSAILDRQGLMEAAPVDLRTKKAEGFSPQALQDFWSRIKMKNPKIVVMSSTAFSEYTNRNEVKWQQCRLCLAMAEWKNSMGSSARKATQVDFSQFWRSFTTILSLYRSRVSEWFQRNGKFEQFL